ALLAALIVAVTVTRLAPHRRGALYLAALFPAIVMTVLFALDIASFATQRWLAVSLTRSLVKLWAQAWWKGEQLLPVSAGLLIAALIVVVTTVMLEIMIWAKTLRDFRPALPRRPACPERSRRAAIAAVILLTCGYAVFFQQIASRAWRTEFIGADPIVAFVS